VARKIIWSHNAQKDRADIFAYWNEHNKSKEFSRKLNKLFNNTIESLVEHPYIGRKTARENVHVKIIREFLIIYKIGENSLIILNIWDGRRNLDDMP
jgi:addiction module RelE/StbE family toxin